MVGLVRWGSRAVSAAWNQDPLSIKLSNLDPGGEKQGLIYAEGRDSDTAWKNSLLLIRDPWFDDSPGPVK